MNLAAQSSSQTIGTRLLCAFPGKPNTRALATVSLAVAETSRMSSLEQAEWQRGSLAYSPNEAVGARGRRAFFLSSLMPLRCAGTRGINGNKRWSGDKPTWKPAPARPSFGVVRSETACLKLWVDRLPNAFKRRLAVHCLCRSRSSWPIVPLPGWTRRAFRSRSQRNDMAEVESKMHALLEAQEEVCEV
jgi:hypothetical protein